MFSDVYNLDTVSLRYFNVYGERMSLSGAYCLVTGIFARQMKEGKDFADMAREHSDGPSSTKGGDLGKFKFEVMAKAFSEAAFALDIFHADFCAFEMLQPGNLLIYRGSVGDNGRYGKKKRRLQVHGYCKISNLGKPKAPWEYQDSCWTSNF